MSAIASGASCSSSVPTATAIGGAGAATLGVTVGVQPPSVAAIAEGSASALGVTDVASAPSATAHGADGPTPVIVFSRILEAVGPYERTLVAGGTSFERVLEGGGPYERTLEAA